MKTYSFQAENLLDWRSFHREFKRVMQFPVYYGENMNAWIDCVDEQTDELSLILIENGSMLKEQAPEILEAILEGIAFINFRKMEAGEQPSVLVSTSC